MKKLQLALCAVGAYLVLIGAFALVGSRPATGQADPPPLGVLVKNSSSQPVPVVSQGSSSVQGTVGIDPAKNLVKAAQDGEWNVGINGTPTVNLAQGAIVGVVNRSPRIFRHELWGINNAPGDPRRSYTNSTSDLLVIEMVAGGVLYDQSFTLTITRAGQEVADYILAAPTKLPQDASMGHELTRIYIMPGETINLPSTAFADLSGHFEAVPSGGG